MQSFSQAVTRWGAQRAQTMGTATTITAVLGGLTSPGDLADLEKVCGQRRVRRESAHRTTGGHQNRDQSRTISWEGETVLRADQIRTLPAGVALVLWSRLPPFLAYLPLLSELSGWREVQREEKSRPGSERPRQAAPGYWDRPAPLLYQCQLIRPVFSVLGPRTSPPKAHDNRTESA